MLTTANVAADVILHVDDDAKPGGDGLTWPTAFIELSDAITVAADVANNVCEIHVAGGAYRPDPVDRTVRFELIEGVAIRGGYLGLAAGKGEDPDTRDIVLYETILTGDLLGDDGPNFENIAENSYQVVRALNVEIPASIDGFTITGGNADGPDFKDKYGGGIHLVSSNVTISSCLITANMAFLGGGAVRAFDGGASALIDCSISGNAIADTGTGGGGGVRVDGDCFMTLTDCLIADNIGDVVAGGLYNNGNVTAIRCTFSANIEEGFYNVETALIVGCEFRDHSIQAALYSSGDLVIRDSMFIDNVTAAMRCAGGGDPTATISNCLFTGNSTFSGGAIDLQNDVDAQISSCTIVGNTASIDGGGIRIAATPQATVTNCVIWGNTDSGGNDESAQIHVADGSSVSFHFNCVQGLTGALGGMGNIGDDPLFATGAQGDFYLSQLDAGQVEQSPCVDAANPNAVLILGATRTDEIADSDTLDMGFHYDLLDQACCLTGGECLDIAPASCVALQGAPGGEGTFCDDTDCSGAVEACCFVDGTCQDLALDVCDLLGGTPQGDATDCFIVDCPPALLLLVDVDATGANNGSSWEDAYVDLQNALANAIFGTEIWVAQGAYTPARPNGPRTRSFQLLAAVEIYGGFEGNEKMRDERDYVAHLTILSGDLNADDATVGNAENSYHVLCGEDAGDGSLLDGFIVTAGNADGAGSDAWGAGLLANAFLIAPSIANCTFIGNTANTGGAIFTSNVMTLRNCRFEQNHAKFGGAIENSGGFDLTIIGCTFEGNSAEFAGGAMEGFIGRATIIDSRFLSNTAGTGGAIESIGCDATTLINCTFSGNSAGVGGAINLFDFPIPTLINCTFHNNTATNMGGAINCFKVLMVDFTVTNCILWNNTPNQIDGDGFGVVVTYSNVQGGWEGRGNIDADPLFVDALGADGAPGTEDDDARLQAGSPSIDAGDNAALPPEIITDLDGLRRFVDDPATRDTGAGAPPIVDMGAYEFQIDDEPIGDLDGDGIVGTADLILLLGAWGPCDDCRDCPADLDGDCAVGTSDLILLLGNWG